MCDVDVRELCVAGAWEFLPTVHSDSRGIFLEWFRHEPLERLIGHGTTWKQANLSVSDKGVLRGIHYSVASPGQAKYVTAVSGSALDFVVDIRPGSPTFGQWDCVQLDTTTRRAVYISAGLGHAFVALDDATILTYLCSETFDPSAELSIHPLDSEIGLALPFPQESLVISPRDTAAPSLREALETGQLVPWSVTL